MKKASIYLLLFLYTAVQLKPLTAVLQDVFAHTFFKMQHMATVHYENGHYHLHKDLKAIHEENSASKQGQKAPSQNPNEIFSPQQVQELNFNISLSGNYPSIIPVPVKDPLSGFTQINSPPPDRA